jgi:hypothetical protein
LSSLAVIYNPQCGTEHYTMEFAELCFVYCVGVRQK